MRIIDRKKINEEIISRVKSVPSGVDWRIIRLRRQFYDYDDADADERPPVLNRETSMAASL